MSTLDEHGKLAKALRHDAGDTRTETAHRIYKEIREPRDPGRGPKDPVRPEDISKAENGSEEHAGVLQDCLLLYRIHDA